MEFSQEWRSLWPISYTHTLPLLLQCRSLGPLVFIPISGTEALLLSSPSLSPPVLPPLPSLSLARFLQTSTSRDSPVLPSTASTIAASFDDHPSNDAVLHNRLEPLRCPGDRLIIFFPTGPNLDGVGFLVISVRDANLVTDSISRSNLKFNNRIVRLSACPVEECVVDGYSVIGFLVASTLYAVHWFAVKIGGHGSELGTPALMYLGCKSFKSCAVAHACWNLHVSGECVVLLESGELFLFDMKSSRLSAKFRGKRISVPWKDANQWKASEWFSCVFGWHPRILIVANSTAVYIVDLTSGKCQLKCLVTIESLDAKEVVGEGHFVAFSKAGSDDFLYSVATEHWLLLLDCRKPLVPVLRWAHNLQKPRYMTALPLSYLRSNPGDEKYVGVSDMGFAIILGSFWNNDFSIFCYGRPPSATLPPISAGISKLSDVIYAWELPSLLSLRGQNCLCGSCLVTEDSAKEDLPQWIEWQRKRELVLGFFILDEKLSSFLQKPGKHGGFTLIRLMSSGKLESQQYRASWKVSTVSTPHEETGMYLEEASLLSSMADNTYDLAKKFSYFKFEYLYGYLNDNLAKLLFSKFRRAPKIASEETHPDDCFFNFMSEKLKSFGCNPPISDLSRSDIFRDVGMPTSLFEVACRVLWTKVPLSDHFVAPVLPLPAALVTYEISKHDYSSVEKIDELSLEKAFVLQCETIASLAKEVGVSYSSSGEDKQCPGSLVDDNEETLVGSLNATPLFLYKASACPNEPAGIDIMENPEEFSPEGERHDLFVAKLPKNERLDEEINTDVMKLFDDLCPVELKFSSPEAAYAPEELKEYKLLQTQFSKWQDSFIPYRDLCARLKSRQHDVKPYP